MDDEQIKNIIEEYICPICQNIPIIPVKLKILKNIENFEMSIGFCLKNWTVCNDVFCQECIEKYLLSSQTSNKNMHRLQCPVCRQNIMISKDMFNYLDCFIKDIKLKKICYLVQQSNTNWKCNYDCNFTTNEYETLLHHLQECENRIVKCNYKDCKILSKLKNLENHELNCPCSFINCPFCSIKLPSREDIIPHLEEYHNIENGQDFTITIHNLLEQRELDI